MSRVSEIMSQYDIPEDITMEEMARLIMGLPIERNGIIFDIKFNITDDDIEQILYESGIRFDGEEVKLVV